MSQPDQCEVHKLSLLISGNPIWWEGPVVDNLLSTMSRNSQRECDFGKNLVVDPEGFVVVTWICQLLYSTSQFFLK